MKLAKVILSTIITITLPFSLANKKQNMDKNTEESKTKAEKWLIKYSDNLDNNRSEKTWYLKKIYKLTNNKNVENYIKNQLSYLNHTEISNKDNEKEITNSKEIISLLHQLLEKKCQKEIASEETKKIKNTSEKIFLTEKNTESFMPTNWVIISYFLKELESPLSKNIEEEILNQSCLKEKDYKFENHLKPKDIECLYYLTHIIITKSDYYSKYVESNNFKIKKIESLLNNAAKTLSKKRILDSTVEIDISSEILISLKLMRNKENKYMEKLYKKIISAQNNSGSWGKDESNNNAEIHNTFVAYEALSLRNPNLKLKNTKVYCKNID